MFSFGSRPSWQSLTNRNDDSANDLVVGHSREENDGAAGADAEIVTHRSWWGAGDLVHHFVDGADRQEGHGERERTRGMQDEEVSAPEPDTLGGGAAAESPLQRGDIVILGPAPDVGRVPQRLLDVLPQRLSRKIEALSNSPPSNPVQGFLDVATALPDLASLALPPRFAGDVCTLMGGIDGSQRSSTGVAVGLLLAPALAVSQVARLLGIDLTPETFGFHEDAHHSPASAAARLDSIDLRQMYVESKDEEPQTCAICQSDFQDGVYALVMVKCSHAFHPQCLNPWLDRRKTCPCCRETVSTVHFVTGEKDTKEDAGPLSE